MISHRAFLIACNRSRLLANMKEKDLLELADVLVSDGAGKIMYTPFLVHIRAVCSSLAQGLNNDEHTPYSQNMGGIGVYTGVGKELLNQLLVNGVNDQGLLHPIREWLIKYTKCCHKERSSRQRTVNDATSISDAYDLLHRDTHHDKYGDGDGNNKFDHRHRYEVTVSEFIQLLRDFNVMYRLENVAELLQDIGVFPSQSVVSSKKGNEVFQDKFTEIKLDHQHGANEDVSVDLRQLKRFANKAFDARALIYRLQQV